MYLSYLMGAGSILDRDLTDLGVEIVGKAESGSRKLKIPTEKIEDYKNLIREKLDPGFWNEMTGEQEIVFVFKFKDKHVEEYVLSPETESQIDKLCTEFNNEPPDATANVYKYISENGFYRDFMMEHYKDLIERSSPGQG